MLKPKVGDLVRLKPQTVIKTDEKDNSFQFFDGPSLTSWAFSDQIEEILPHPLAVGDRVQVRDQFDKDIFAVVIGIDEDAAWLKWNIGGPRHNGGNRNSHRLVDLVRIDPA